MLPCFIAFAGWKRDFSPSPGLAIGMVCGISSQNILDTANMAHQTADKPTVVDVALNRKEQKWSLRAQFGRLAWAVVSPAFRYSPRPLWGWRRLMLRLFGAHISNDVHIFPSVRIQIPWNISIGQQTAIGDRVILYALGPISIGEQVTVSQGAHLCAGTHDFRDGKMTLLKPPITVENGVWICADAFIGPGVTIAERAIVGARAVVMRDVEAGVIVAGNPAVKSGLRDRPAKPATGETDAAVLEGLTRGQ